MGQWDYYEDDDGGYEYVEDDDGNWEMETWGDYSDSRGCFASLAPAAALAACGCALLLLRRSGR